MQAKCQSINRVIYLRGAHFVRRRALLPLKWREKLTPAGFHRFGRIEVALKHGIELQAEIKFIYDDDDDNKSFTGFDG